VLLVALFLALWAYASYRRGQAIGVKWKFHLLILILPIWILALGFVPAVSEANGQPLRKASNFLFGGIVIASVFVVAVYLLTDWSLAPRLPSNVQMALKNSDDYDTYARQFSSGALQLIAAKKCDAEDFICNGGFVKSVSKLPKDVYFLHCKDLNRRTRFYFDPNSDQFYR